MRTNWFAFLYKLNLISNYPKTLATVAPMSAGD